MYGKAILEIPRSGNIGPSRTEGLSDELATVIGLTAALSLSDEDGCVVITLSDGETKVIRPGALHNELSIGRLTWNR